MQERVTIGTLINRKGKGVVQDHYLVGVAKYPHYEQLWKDFVESLSAKKHLGGDSSVTSAVKTAERQRFTSIGRCANTVEKLVMQRRMAGVPRGPTGTSKGNFGQGGENNSTCKDEDDRAQPVCFRRGNTVHLKGQVGGLSTQNAVDLMGNDGLKENCAVEEIRRINGVD